MDRSHTPVPAQLVHHIEGRTRLRISIDQVDAAALGPAREAGHGVTRQHRDDGHDDQELEQGQTADLG